MKTTASAGGTRPRRADAQRNIAAMLDAAQACVERGDELTMAAVARGAGVSRVTLYTHFPTLPDVVEATVARVISELDVSLAGLGLDDGEAPAALARMVTTQWRTLNSSRRLYTAAVTELPASKLRELHGPLMRRLRALIRRGQKAGEFRSDLPIEWLIATIFGLMHQAAEEVNAARLPERRAGEIISATVLPALAPPN